MGCIGFFILENIMKFAKKAIAIIGLGLAQLSAQAAFVSNWDYSVSTVWTAATFTGTGGTQIETANEISWGGDNNGGAAGVGDLIVGSGNRSGIRIEGSPQTGTVVTDGGTPELTSVYTHINNPISSAFGTLATATTQTTLTLTANPPAGPIFGVPPKTFDINFAETLNSAGTCVTGSTSVCDDVFVITLGSLNQMFEYDGFNYFLSIVKMLGPLDPLSSDACTTAGATSPCLGFLTAEGVATSVEFGLLITSEPVNIPEPGVLSLMGLAMLGLVVARRRQV